ncbi:hypothetical protein TNCV_4755301 [Trichonephila clavipes]|nr:hypothetical protein TNCV_4755301 [Trichonephila clavipes]
MCSFASCLAFFSPSDQLLLHNYRNDFCVHEEDIRQEEIFLAMNGKEGAKPSSVLFRRIVSERHKGRLSYSLCSSKPILFQLHVVCHPVRQKDYYISFERSRSGEYVLIVFEPLSSCFGEIENDVHQA